MIEDIYPKEWQESRGLFSPAKKIDLGAFYLIYVSGQQASKDERSNTVHGDIEAQTQEVFQLLAKTLEAAGASMSNVVKAQLFLTDIDDLEKVSAIRDKWFTESRPVSTLVEVNAMTRKGAKIEIELTAIMQK